jgi:hypothetical protein
VNWIAVVFMWFISMTESINPSGWVCQQGNEARLKISEETANTREQAMNRRSFIVSISAGLAAIGLAPKSEAGDYAKMALHLTLTGRILRTLKHRRELGQASGAICVSHEGFKQIEREHGLEDNGLDISLRGVPVFRRNELKTVDDYWVLDTRRGL